MPGGGILWRVVDRKSPVLPADPDWPSHSRRKAYHQRFLACRRVGSFGDGSSQGYLQVVPQYLVPGTWCVSGSAVIRPRGCHLCPPMAYHHSRRYHQRYWPIPTMSFNIWGCRHVPSEPSIPSVSSANPSSACSTINTISLNSTKACR
jgi:hypothetical protein